MFERFTPEAELHWFLQTAPFHGTCDFIVDDFVRKLMKFLQTTYRWCEIWSVSNTDDIFDSPLIIVSILRFLSLHYLSASCDINFTIHQRHLCRFLMHLFIWDHNWICFLIGNLETMIILWYLTMILDKEEWTRLRSCVMLHLFQQDNSLTYMIQPRILFVFNVLKLPVKYYLDTVAFCFVPPEKGCRLSF